MEYRKTRPPMPISQRAKQFMPFAAVKGLEEAIAAKERELSRKEWTECGEEQSNRINRTLCQLEKRDFVRLTWYSSGTREYRTVCGTVDEIIPEKQLLRIDGEVVPFDKITELENTNLL